MSIARTDAPLLPLSYATMRLRWCVAALRAFVKRWGVYLAMAGMTFGAGATGGLTAVAAVSTWTVLPLSWSVAQANWTLAALAPLIALLLLQTAASVGLLRALRPMLWPAAWRDSEAALPLQADQQRRSDAVVAALVLLLWWGVQGLGLINLLVQDPAWLRPVRTTATLAWLGTQALAWGLGVWGLQRARCTAVGGLRAARQAVGLAAQTQPLRWQRVLLVLPLGRGVAHTLGWWWLGSAVLLGMPALALWRWPIWAPAIFALWSMAALVLTSRLNHLSRQSLGPLLREATATLPLPAAALERQRRLHLLLPALAGALLLLASAQLGPATALLRPTVLASWTLWAAISLWWASGLPLQKADEAALRWLLSLVLLLALSSEVLP